ncbi:unnamed protein product, partial [marine sediment metagenome]
SICICLTRMIPQVANKTKIVDNRYIVESSIKLKLYCGKDSVSNVLCLPKRFKKEKI